MENLIKLKEIKERLENKIIESNKIILDIENNINIIEQKLNFQAVFEAGNLNTLEDELKELQSKLSNEKDRKERFKKENENFFKNPEILKMYEDIHKDIYKEITRLQEENQKKYDKALSYFEKVIQYDLSIKENNVAVNELRTLYSNILPKKYKKPLNIKNRFLLPNFYFFEAEYLKKVSTKKERPGWLKAQEERDKKVKEQKTEYLKKKQEEAKKSIEKRKNFKPGENKNKNALNAWYYC